MNDIKCSSCNENAIAFLQWGNKEGQKGNLCTKHADEIQKWAQGADRMIIVEDVMPQVSLRNQ